jgi:hypothetical protein
VSPGRDARTHRAERISAAGDHVGAVAFRNGDYELLGVRRITETRARLEYEPHGLPYGGSECMVALVEAFGSRVAGVRD